MSYYKKFSLLLGNPLWPWYLRSQYKAGLRDTETLNASSPLAVTKPTCLLSGCGHEQTADTFIRFITAINPNTSFIIIDLGKPQIQAINKLVKQEHSDKNIKVIQANALQMGELIPPSSIDWIETDWFMEYFDSHSLPTLIANWYTVLKPGGIVTSRDAVSDGLIGSLADKLRISGGNAWLDSDLFQHSLQEYTDVFTHGGFKSTVNHSLVPGSRRFTLVK